MSTKVPEDPDHKFRVQFSLVGIRNLLEKAKRPQVSVWLSNEPGKKKVFVVDDDEEFRGYNKALL